MSVVKAPIEAVRLVRVVDASVDEPVTFKFPAVSVPEIVDEPELSEVRDPFTPTKLVKVVEASVEDPVTFKLAAVSVPAMVEEAAFSPPVIAPFPCTVVLPSVVEARVDEPVTAKEVVAVSTPTVAELVSEVEAFKVAMLEVVAKEVEA